MPTATTITPQLLQGTLDLLVLATLSRGPAHGYAIARSIELATERALKVEEGSLYPALNRLRKKGQIAGEWQTSATGRRAKVYRLTPDGRRSLEQQRGLWALFVSCVADVLDPRRPAEHLDLEGLGD